MSLAKNATFLTFAYVGQKIFSFLYFTLITRFIGVEATGMYTFSLSFAGLFAVFVDLGFTPILIREVAQDRKRAASYLSAICVVKSFLSALVAAMLGISLFFLQKPFDMKLMIALALLTMILDAFTLSFWGVFRGFQNLRYESMAIIVSQAITLLVGTGALLLHAPLYTLLFALLVGSVFQIIWSAALLRNKLGVAIKPYRDVSLMKKITVLSIPFALSAVFARLFGLSDQLLLAFLSGEKFLGLYSVPYKITFALQFIPIAFSAALYPAISEAYDTNRAKLAHLYETGLKYMTVISFPIAFGIFALSRDIIMMVYSDAFALSIPALSFMSLSIIFSFLTFPVGALLNGCNRQKQHTWILAAVLVSNVVLNFILIPRSQHIGASISLLISYGIFLVLGMFFANRLVRLRMGMVFFFAKTLFLAMIMMLGVIWSKNFIHFLAAIPVGGLIYTVGLFVFRIVDRHDLNELLSYFRKPSTHLSVEEREY
ncbi:MAG: flippase [Parcubacteria group bacterium]|nr:flippase [Parcubacteria group bacterium]